MQGQVRVQAVVHGHVTAGIQGDKSRLSVHLISCALQVSACASCKLFWCSNSRDKVFGYLQLCCLVAILLCTMSFLQAHFWLLGVPLTACTLTPSVSTATAPWSAQLAASLAAAAARIHACLSTQQRQTGLWCMTSAKTGGRHEQQPGI
jgi:hypothetical protein